MADIQGLPTRRTPYEVVIDPECVRPHVRRRIAVHAVFAADWASAATLLLEQMEKDSGGDQT